MSCLALFKNHLHQNMSKITILNSLRYIKTEHIFLWSLGNEKQRTLSKKRKTRSAKAGGYAAIATSSEAFSKPREIKRFDSVAISDDDDDDADNELTEISTSTDTIRWDKVSKR